MRTNSENFLLKVGRKTLRVGYTLLWAASLAVNQPAACTPDPSASSLPWISPMHYRVLLEVDPIRDGRVNSPTRVDLNLQGMLRSMGAPGKVDDSTIEVVAYSNEGWPKVFDPSRQGYEKFLVPHRVDKYYPIDTITLSFVMPSSAYTTYAVYFDTVESGLGRPTRYPGLVGDGDWFCQHYGRREIAANRYDTFADIDGDGDLDLLKGGTEPYIYVWENVGQNRYVERGRLTNGGALWELPKENVNNRSWLSVEANDWDNDGDQDLFIHFVIASNNYSGKVVRYENVTPKGGPLTFIDRGPIVTQSGYYITTTVTIVDWDGDGRKDILAGQDGIVTFYKNIGNSNNLTNIALADGQYLCANGVPIQLWSPRMDCADIDSDGDLDLFVGMEDGRIYLFENLGTRTSPLLAEGRIIAFYEGGYMDLGPGIKVADFDGDGLLDFAVGRYWERSHWGWDPRVYGRLYKNVGTPTHPKFQIADAWSGCPYTEGFQRINANRQNGVRAVDWDNDGRVDLIASDTDGFVWLYRNTTNQLFPLFEDGVRLKAGDEYIKVLGEEERRVRDGYARTDVCDWNNDGRKDLLVADGRGWIFLYLNVGSDSNPVLSPGVRLYAWNQSHTAQLPIDGTARSSVMVCDWDGDGKKDVIHAICGQGNYSENYNWPPRSADRSWESGFLFYRNVGTDAQPVLDYPKWITDRYGNVITYSSRPNCGSFVDWDGDGKKDFIAAEFENSIRLYRNVGNVVGEPVFNDTNGVVLVRPYTVQMISGADAIDWNRDGDIDILTGQGHGGTGLRFYERDYIEDCVNDTFPLVAICTKEHAFDIHEAKQLPDGTGIVLPRTVVSAVFDGFFYVQSEHRTSGIRVDLPNHGRKVGERVDVRGIIKTHTHGERYIEASAVTLHPAYQD
ncbi:MAG: VCBS repeat-containing protein [Armatimonadota bacterium]|nr:VCBS repeat-containing protein [Armatimonadota bacterium]